jgi:hypothetical protein
LEQDPENYDYGINRHRYGVRHTGLLLIRSTLRPYSAITIHSSKK